LVFCSFYSAFINCQQQFWRSFLPEPKKHRSLGIVELQVGQELKIFKKYQPTTIEEKFDFIVENRLLLPSTIRKTYDLSGGLTQLLST